MPITNAKEAQELADAMHSKEERLLEKCLSQIEWLAKSGKYQSPEWRINVVVRRQLSNLGFTVMEKQNGMAVVVWKHFEEDVAESEKRFMVAFASREGWEPSHLLDTPPTDKFLDFTGRLLERDSALFFAAGYNVAEGKTWCFVSEVLGVKTKAEMSGGVGTGKMTFKTKSIELTPDDMMRYTG